MLQPESAKELLLSFLALLPSVLDKTFKIRERGGIVHIDAVRGATEGRGV
jgi:hypothetical protein